MRRTRDRDHSTRSRIRSLGDHHYCGEAHFNRNSKPGVFGSEAKAKHMNADSLDLLESNSCPSCLSSQSSQSSTLVCDFEKLKLIEEIGRGRYGAVWTATLDGQAVAVKKFGPQNRQYFLNERDIYLQLLPFVANSQCLPRFHGFQEIVGTDSRPEYHLVLSYASLGCLQDYLRNQTIDWLTLCKMIASTTEGLAYLHSEVKEGNKFKPCVAHRDLSSRNILVKADNTCMICDFQFAIRTSGSEYYSCGQRFDSQKASLKDVGSLRYMAPEVLEGAVNLRDCESTLKQIDVYALGLVLWEMASRCQDLYQGVEVPHYKQPFEHEIGLTPTFEQMQVMVIRYKARPLFPDIWKDSNPAIRALKETIEDCWDPDAEARLTALCVEKRLLELPLLWERHKNGALTNCAGAIYSMSTQSQNNQKNVLRVRNGNNGYHNLIAGIGCSEPNGKVTNELHSNRFINRLEYPNNNLNISNNNNSNHINDSLVSYSASTDFEKNIVSAANAVIHQPKLSLPLQPHQGRNPCLERNLMLESSDDNTTALLEHGLKFQINSSTNDSLFADNVFNENNTNNESNGLVNNDLMNRSTHENTRNVSSSRRTGNGVTPIPIPYLQNAVGINTIPKRPNVTGNGQSVQTKLTNETSNAQNSSESGFTKIFKWKHIKALKDWHNIKMFGQKEVSSNKASVGEREPFGRNNGNTGGLTARDDSQNIRPDVRAVSNSLISSSPQSAQSHIGIGSGVTKQLSLKSHK